MPDGGERRGGGAVVPLVPRELGGGPVRAQHLPLREIWALWWQGPGAQLRNRNSRKNYVRCHQLSESLPDYPRPENVEAWTARLVDAVGLGERTADMHRYILGGVYRWALERGLSTVNPVAQSKRKPPPPAESHPIRNIAEVWPALAAVARDATEAAFLGVLRYTGVRPEEAPALLPEDVLTRTEPWELSVTKQRTTRDAWTTKAPKGARQRGSRRIPIRPELRDLLAPVLASWRPVQLRFGTRGMARGEQVVRFLFPYRSRELEDLRARLGAVAPEHFGPGHGLHTFRHTCAFELYEAGVEVVTISEWLGHESVLTTEKYLARMAGGKVRADKALAQFFGGPVVPPREPVRPAPPVRAVVTKRGPSGSRRPACFCTHPEAAHAGGGVCRVCGPDRCPSFAPCELVEA